MQVVLTLTNVPTGWNNSTIISAFSNQIGTEEEAGMTVAFRSEEVLETSVPVDVLLYSGLL